MRKIYYTIVLSIAALFCNGLVLHAAKAPVFELPASIGESVNLTDFSGKFVVLEWTNYSCPFVKKFYSAGKMQELQSSMKNKGVVWLTICSSAPGKQGYMSPDQINTAMKKSNANPNFYLIDERGEVGKLYQAKATPHMTVINPEGVVIYDGAIDSIRSTRSKDIPEAINYVKVAIAEAMAGKPVSTPKTKAYGCGIKY